MSNIYGVNFKNDGKVYYFLADELVCPINVTVIVETERGQQFGKVVSQLKGDNQNINKDNLKSIIRISSKDDYKQYLKNLKDAKDAITFANNIIGKLKLNMKIIDSDFTFDRKQLLFTFTSDTRIDFRKL